MRIAISSEEKNGLDSRISHHFGRCPSYILVDVEGEDVQAVQSVDNPFAQNHQPGMVPEYIHNQGVNVMISGGMGMRAISFFDQYGIDVATGADGTVQTTLDRYFKGQLGGAQPCRESVEHHDHDHH
jgi:predicted Fe-Mo cluster-binding NifX family protein